MDARGGHVVESHRGRERRLTLRDESDLVVARHHARTLGKEQGLAPVAIEALATALTEIARNVLVHARAGEARLVAIRAARGGIERNLVAVEVKDNGPGIANIEAAMVDGYSTGEGLGMGLSGARRMVDAFTIVSTVGEGTTITLEKWAAPPPAHL
jgi:serine/threonine-protein kinase RsbT